MSTNPYASPSPESHREPADGRMPVQAIKLLRSMKSITATLVVLALFAIGFALMAGWAIWEAISFEPLLGLGEDFGHKYLGAMLLSGLKAAVYSAAFSYAARRVWDYRSVMRGIALETATWDEFSHTHREVWSGIVIAALTILVANALAGAVSAWIVA